MTLALIADATPDAWYIELIKSGGPIIVGLAGMTGLVILFWKFAGKEMVAAFVSISGSFVEATKNAKESAEASKQATENSLAAANLSHAVVSEAKALVETVRNMHTPAGS